MDRSLVGKGDTERNSQISKFGAHQQHQQPLHLQEGITTTATATTTTRNPSNSIAESMVVLTSERERTSGAGGIGGDSDGGEPEGKHGRHQHQDHRGRESEVGAQDYNREEPRRSRSGRPLRSTVQYDERSSRSSSVESKSGTRRQQQQQHQHYKSFGDDSKQDPQSSEAQDEENQRSDQKSRTGYGPDGASPSDEEQQQHHRQQQHQHQQQQQHRDQRYDEDGDGDARDELLSDDEQDDDGFGEGGDGGSNEDGSESMDTNSSKNDDGTEPLVVSMYGSPSLVKVRSMFIDKLYKMVEDQSIQHLISWAKEGDMFYVFNCVELSTTVLPKFFKHNNWQSFVRQLNMYGFHKIYRYDREESTMNRRNPETQRWQFYHPDFQRDRPHLRSNIKRKSARSINLAPTFSRVVFERDKGGYYIQQEPPNRTAGGGGSSVGSVGGHPGGHIPGSGGPHHQQLPPGPQGDAGPRIAPRPSGDYRMPSHPSESGYPRDDPRYHSSRQPDMRRDYGPPPPSHLSPHLQPSLHGHKMASHPPQQPYTHTGGPHQRQHSYAGPAPQGRHRPDHPYGYPPQHPSRSVGPPSQPPHPSERPMDSPSAFVREAERLEAGAHGYPAAGGHSRSQSAPGLDPRRELSRVPHPLSQPEHSRPSPQSTPQSYFPREPYTPQSRTSFEGSTAKSVGEPVGTPGEGPHRSSLQKHPLSPTEHPLPQSSGSDRAPPGPGLPPLSEQPWAGGAGRSPDEYGSRRHSPGSGTPQHLAAPPPPGHPAGGHSGSTPTHFSSQRSGGLQPPHSVDSIPTTPSGGPPGADSVNSINHGGAPISSPNVQDLVPRTALKAMEGRLHFVEEAYMSLRQFAQELQQIQHHQDQTIAWMRDRIQQMAEMSPRDTMTSPPQQAGVVPAKRKVEYSAEDGREWGGRRPIEHQPAPGERSGPGTPGSVGYSANAPPQSGFHPSFNPIHHQQQQQQHGHHPSHHQHHPQHAHPHAHQQQSRQQHPSPLMNEPPLSQHHPKVPRHD